MVAGVLFKQIASCQAAGERQGGRRDGGLRGERLSLEGCRKVGAEDGQAQSKPFRLLLGCGGQGRDMIGESSECEGEWPGEMP